LVLTRVFIRLDLYLLPTTSSNTTLVIHSITSITNLLWSPHGMKNHSSFVRLFIKWKRKVTAASNRGSDAMSGLFFSKCKGSHITSNKDSSSLGTYFLSFVCYIKMLCRNYVASKDAWRGNCSGLC
jgi:hypothetical protein